MITMNFSKLHDPRGGQARQYPMGPLLSRFLLAILSGACSLRAICRWCKNNHDDLNILLGTTWKKSPSQHLFDDIPKLVNEMEMDLAFSVRPCVEGEVLHVDGKALRGSVKAGSPMEFMTTIFRGMDEVALATAFHGKNKEGQAARDALDRLCGEGNLKGVWFTFDALHTQKNG